MLICNAVVCTFRYDGYKMDNKSRPTITDNGTAIFIFTLPLKYNLSSTEHYNELYFGPQPTEKLGLLELFIIVYK